MGKTDLVAESIQRSVLYLCTEWFVCFPGTGYVRMCGVFVGAELCLMLKPCLCSWMLSVMWEAICMCFKSSAVICSQERKKEFKICSCFFYILWLYHLSHFCKSLWIKAFAKCNILEKSPYTVYYTIRVTVNKNRL